MIALLTACLLSATEPVLVDRIVASVDDRAITRSMVDLRMKLGGTTRVAARDALIERFIVQSECDRLRISVDGEEIDRALDAVAASNRITKEQLVTAVEAQGMDLKGYREELRNQLLDMRWVMREGEQGATPQTAEGRAAWLDATRRKLLEDARGRAAIDVREGEP